MVNPARELYVVFLLTVFPGIYLETEEICDLPENIPGPHSSVCLKKWWLDAGCSIEGRLSPTKNCSSTSGWQSQTTAKVRADMAHYFQNILQGVTNDGMYTYSQLCLGQNANAGTFCPGDWKKLSGKCYKLFPSAAKSWEDARVSCQSFGGDLAMLKDPNILTTLEVNLDHGDVWLGLSDKEEEGIFKWLDGQPLLQETVPWDAAQPDGLKNENCVFVRTNGWNDASCENHLDLARYLCETENGIWRSNGPEKSWRSWILPNYISSLQATSDPNWALIDLYWAALSQVRARSTFQVTMNTNIVMSDWSKGFTDNLVAVKYKEADQRTMCTISGQSGSTYTFQCSCTLKP